VNGVVTVAVRLEYPQLAELRLGHDLAAEGPLDEIEAAAAYLRESDPDARQRILDAIAAKRTARAMRPPGTARSMRRVE
jgi:hypothetical protein